MAIYIICNFWGRFLITVLLLMILKKLEKLGKVASFIGLGFTLRWKAINLNMTCIYLVLIWLQIIGSLSQKKEGGGTVKKQALLIEHKINLTGPQNVIETRDFRSFRVLLNAPRLLSVSVWHAFLGKPGCTTSGVHVVGIKEVPILWDHVLHIKPPRETVFSL